MSGNWGFEFIDHVRSRRPWRTRLVLTVASLLAGVVLVAVVLQFGGGKAGEFADELIVLLGLLALGIMFGLRPWARK